MQNYLICRLILQSWLQLWICFTAYQTYSFYYSYFAFIFFIWIIYLLFLSCWFTLIWGFECTASNVLKVYLNRQIICLSICVCVCARAHGYMMHMCAYVNLHLHVYIHANMALQKFKLVNSSVKFEIKTFRNLHSRACILCFLWALFFP